MEMITLHDLIIELRKKKIGLGADPKATVSMYSELGLIPPAKINARPDSDLEPEISYPLDTIEKIIEIKKLKSKGLQLACGSFSGARRRAHCSFPISTRMSTRSSS